MQNQSWGSLAILSLTFGLVYGINGGSSQNIPTSYTAASGASRSGGLPVFPLKSASYQYTGMGSAESNIDFAPDGSLIYAPAFTAAGNGYAVSRDQGQTWSQVLPGGSGQPRIQPVFRQINGRYYYWSSSIPGLYFEYSDDQGKTWSPPLNSSHFDPLIQDWAKLVSGPPVSSKLSNGAKEILYLSAPSFISTPLPVEPVGPENQLIMKSADNGNTWAATKGRPTLQPLLSGGACAGLVKGLAGQELIIWGDGFVKPNGTIVFGLRRCQKLSLAFSDDEGDSWRLMDVPGSSLPPFFPGDLTYLFNGNVLVPEPISLDIQGNIFAVWVDSSYTLQMSKSADNAQTWSAPVVIAAPNGANRTMAYLPTLRHHPTIPGRAALAYYGSADGGATYNGYIAETGNLLAPNPVFSSIVGNPISAPMQHNQIPQWDQGYGDPFYDLVEFVDVRYAPQGSGFTHDDLVTAFSRRMCTAQSQPPQTYPRNSCIEGWDYDSHAQSAWQGMVLVAHH